MPYRYGRLVGALAFTMLATTACGGGNPPATSAEAADHSPAQLQRALLASNDLRGGYRKAGGPTSGPVKKLGIQSYAEILRKSKIDKPECSEFYQRVLGTGGLFRKLRDESAAVVSFAGKNRTVSEALVSVPAGTDLTVLRQDFRRACAEFTLRLPDGKELRMEVRKLDVRKLGKRTVAYEVVRTSGDDKAYALSQVVRFPGAMLNIGVRSREPVDRAVLEKITKTAYAKARGELK